MMEQLLSRVEVPTLLLDEAVCRANIRAMADRAARHGLRLRPHAKTHQSRTVAEWMREAGVTGLTVSSLRMAEYFADGGWSDITVAFPVNLRERRRIVDLAGRIHLNLLAESVEAVDALDDMLSGPVGLFIKADTGYGRTGLKPGQWEVLDALVDRLAAADHLQFRGFLCHAGHTYQARGAEAIRQIHRRSTEALRALGDRYRARFPELILSLGDTPGCSVAEDFRGIGEIRPGNFVFYDLDQVRIGACAPAQIAVALACPVVALHPERQDAVLYGGGVHLSTERQVQDDGSLLFGRVAAWTGQGWNADDCPAYLWKISQEHGVARFTRPEAFARLRVGDLVPVLPVHSCMCADAMGGYLSLSGEEVDGMRGSVGRRVQS